jgi:hypothetical protein
MHFHFEGGHFYFFFFFGHESNPAGVGKINRRIIRCQLGGGDIVGLAEDGETVSSGIHERICEEEPIVFVDFNIPTRTIDTNIYC